MKPTPKPMAYALAVAAFFFLVAPAAGFLPLETTVIGMASLAVLYYSREAVQSEALKTVRSIKVSTRTAPVIIREKHAASIEITLSNKGQEPLQLLPLIRVSKEVRAALLPENAMVTLEPGASIRYQIRATAPPGSHPLGTLLLETRDPWGLYSSQTPLPLDARIRVIPNPQEPPLNTLWPNPGTLDALTDSPGNTGLEPHTLKEYEPTDPVNRIAWLVTARVGRLVSWQPRAWARPRLCVFSDLSRASWRNAGADAPGYWISRYTMGLARMVTRNGGKAVFHLFNGLTRRSLEVPGAGNRGLRRLVQSLALYDPRELPVEQLFAPEARRAVSECPFKTMAFLLPPMRLGDARGLQEVSREALRRGIRVVIIVPPRVAGEGRLAGRPIAVALLDLVKPVVMGGRGVRRVVNGHVR